MERFGRPFLGLSVLCCRASFIGLLIIGWSYLIDPATNVVGARGCYITGLTHPLSTKSLLSAPTPASNSPGSSPLCRSLPHPYSYLRSYDMETSDVTLFFFFFFLFCSWLIHFTYLLLLLSPTCIRPAAMSRPHRPHPPLGFSTTVAGLCSYQQLAFYGP